MLFEQRVKQTKLTASEQAIAEYIMDHKYELKNISTRDIAKATFTSSSSVVRFSQKMQYQGFEDLKEDYHSELVYLDGHFQNINPNIPFLETHNTMQIANIMTSLMEETAQDTFSLVALETLEEVASILDKADTIFIYATENNLFLAQSFKYKMLRIQKRVVLEEFYGNQVYSTYVMGKKDCGIVISYSGEGRILESARRLQEMQVPCIAITSIGDNSLKRLATHPLSISSREKLHSKIASFTTEYSISLLLNILYSCVFSKQYADNSILKVERTKEIESARISNSPILSEET